MQNEEHSIIQEQPWITRGSTFDVIVIGGGIIGCGIALNLTERGYKVAIVERNSLGSEASTAAIGGLTPQSDEFCRGQLRRFALESVKEYPRWTNHLTELSGVVIEYHDAGLLEVAFSEEEVEKLERSIELWRREQFVVNSLTRADILKLEPLVNPEVLAGCHLPGEPNIDPRVLMDAVATSLSRLGCEIILGRPVVEVTQLNGCVSGVKLSDGTLYSSKWVVLAAGAWSSFISGIPPCPVEPIKGQALLTKLWPQRFKFHIHASPGYIVPRFDGRVVLGVTYERAGYDKRVTVSGLHQILNTTMRISRAIGNCEILQYWSGLRPRTPDEKPILGLSSRVDKLVYATGHFGVGITLAPVTAHLISDLIDGKPVHEELSSYSPDRFLI